MPICEYCGNEHDGSFGNGRFCNQSCCNSRSCRLINNSETKKVKCSKCGKEIAVKKKADPGKVICSECKKLHSASWKQFRKCSVCGQLDCDRTKDPCSKKQLLPALIKYFLFDPDVIGTMKVHDEYKRVRDSIINEYVTQEKSLLDIAKRINHSYTRNLGKIFGSLGIKLRNHSDALRLAMKLGKINLKHSTNIYKTGYHTSWEDLTFFYRSSYELDYMLELDEKKISYSVESLRISYWDSKTQKERTAIPDFYLPDTNTIVEVKSSFTYDSINLQDRVVKFLKLGYNFKLIYEHQEELNLTGIKLK